MSDPEPARATNGVEREERERQLYLLNAVGVPLLRLTGFVLTAAAVGLHNVYVVRTLSTSGYWLFCTSLMVYSLGSWLVLHLYYRRSRSDGDGVVGWIFHLADVAVVLTVVYATGGEQSRLFFLLLVPIWNQTHFSARRAAFSSVLTAVLYVGLLLFQREVEHRDISLRLAAFRTSSILIISLYCTISALVAERSRRRVTLALRRSRELAERLQSAGRVITESLDLDAVLQLILEQLQQVISFDAGSIHLIEDGAMRVLAVRGHPPQEVGRIRPLDRYPYNKRLAEHPEPCILHNPVATGVLAHDGGILDQMRTVMGLPLVVHDRIIGAMSIDNRRENAYDQRAAEAAMTFARFAAIAIEHARLYATMQELSTLDPVTRVANRRHFDNMMQREWLRALRVRGWFSVLMIDVDDFKAYNDCYGHISGDLVLQQVAAALRSALQRAGDFVARYGGEEFVVLIPGAEPTPALRLAEMLRDRIAGLQIPHERGRAANVVTISAGVASVVAGEDTEPAAVIAAADRFLYTAKKDGRNCVRGEGPG